MLICSIVDQFEVEYKKGDIFGEIKLGECLLIEKN